MSQPLPLSTKIKVGLVLTTFVLVVLAIPFYVFPKYRVWQRGQVGLAALMEAEQTRKIAIEAAKAEEESAKHRAKAIEIVGAAAKKYPEYRQQEFIGAFAEALADGKIDQIIYVPTESNIPIMEATRQSRRP